MDWPEERYVRVYTRDTGDWLSLSFEAQAVWLMVLRKLNRGGRIQLGRGGRQMLASLLGHAAKRKAIDRALDELLADGCVTLEAGGSELFAPRFREAQDWTLTPAERTKRWRDRKKGDVSVTPGDACDGGDASETPAEPASPAVPCRAVPPVPASSGAAADEFTPDGFWLFADGVRRERVPHAPVDVRPKGFDAWYPKAFARAGPDIGIAYCRYLDDGDFEAKGWPMALFMSESIWLSRVPAGLAPKVRRRL